jgi:hypothetical protein
MEMNLTLNKVKILQAAMPTKSFIEEWSEWRMW